MLSVLHKAPNYLLSYDLNFALNVNAQCYSRMSQVSNEKNLPKTLKKIDPSFYSYLPPHQQNFVSQPGYLIHTLYIGYCTLKVKQQ